MTKEIKNLEAPKSPLFSLYLVINLGPFKMLLILSWQCYVPRTIYDPSCALLDQACVVRVLWELPEVDSQSLLLGSVSKLIRFGLI